MADTLYITQKGALALQSAGLAGFTNLKADLVSVVPQSPGRQAVIGDFTLAAYTGYVQQTPVLTGGFVDGTDGPVYALIASIRFVGPSSGPGIAAVGYLFQDSVSHDVWAWGMLDPARQEQVATDVVEITLALFEDESYQIAVLPAA